MRAHVCELYGRLTVHLVRVCDHAALRVHIGTYVLCVSIWSRTNSSTSLFFENTRISKQTTG